MKTATTKREPVKGTLMALAAVVMFPACGGSDKDDGRLYVVATTTMIKDMVGRIGGDKVRIKGLMGPGVDPHLYEPVPADGIALRDADLIFYNGLFLEGQMTETLERKGDKAHALGSSVPKLRLKGDAKHPDPHIWGDASLWAGCIPLMVEALAKADSANAADYRAAGDQLAGEMNALHEWAKGRVAEVPASARVLITSHDAFEYFGEAYGFRVVGLQGISTVDEVGIAERVKLVDFIKANSVKAIFVESSVSQAAIKSIAEDTGVKIGGELFSDAMGEPGEMGSGGGEEYDLGTYSGMIKHNINTAVEALK